MGETPQAIRHRCWRQVPALAALAALALSADPSRAAQGDVPFQGSVTEPNACTIIVDQGGTMIPTADATQMSSSFAGGVPGIARIISFANYWISVDAPASFDTAPPDGFTGVTFAATYSGQSIFRGRTFTERPGSSLVRLRGGFSITQVTVNLTATKPDTFPAGNYLAQATVRCE